MIDLYADLATPLDNPTASNLVSDDLERLEHAHQDANVYALFDSSGFYDMLDKLYRLAYLQGVKDGSLQTLAAIHHSGTYEADLEDRDAYDKWVRAIHASTQILALKTSD